MRHQGYLVFETGGTKLVAGVAGSDSRIVETKLLPRRPSDRADQSLGQLIEAGQQLKQTYERRGMKFQAVGMGFGGYVRRSANQPLGCLHEAGWQDLDVPGVLQQEFGLPTYIENDCKLGALAEAHFGAGRGSRTVFYMTVGTGVGGGIVRDGEIQAMSDIGEAEIGHIVVWPEGPLCSCGNRGCVESVASGPGISQLASCIRRQHGEQWQASSLRDPFPSGDDIPAPKILQAWRAGDVFARIVAERAAWYLAWALAAAINLLSPDVCVVGGGVASGNRDFVALLETKVRPLVVLYFRDRHHIAPSALEEKVVAQGAAILAAQRIGSWPPAGIEV